MILQIVRYLSDRFRNISGQRSSGLLSCIGGISASTFLFLRGRTRARGLALVRCIWREPVPRLAASRVRGLLLRLLERAVDKGEVGSSSFPRPTTLIERLTSHDRRKRS